MLVIDVDHTWTYNALLLHKDHICRGMAVCHTWTSPAYCSLSLYTMYGIHSSPQRHGQLPVSSGWLWCPSQRSSASYTDQSCPHLRAPHAQRYLNYALGSPSAFHGRPAHVLRR
jgi:hypothetical protein